APEPELEPTSVVPWPSAELWEPAASFERAPPGSSTSSSPAPIRMRKQPGVPVRTTSDVPYLILLLTALAANFAGPSGSPPTRLSRHQIRQERDVSLTAS